MLQWEHFALYFIKQWGTILWKQSFAPKRIRLLCQLGAQHSFVQISCSHSFWAVSHYTEVYYTNLFTFVMLCRQKKIAAEKRFFAVSFQRIGLELIKEFIKKNYFTSITNQLCAAKDKLIFSFRSQGGIVNWFTFICRKFLWKKKNFFHQTVSSFAHKHNALDSSTISEH